MKINKFFIIILIFIFLSELFTLSFAEEKKETDFSKAMSYFNKREYKKAIPFFKKAIENNENPCDAYFYLGLSYINLKKYKNAYNISSDFISLCNERLDKNPEDFKAHYYLGYIYELRSFVPGINEYEKAILHFTKASEIEPKNLLPVEHIAFCYLQMKKYEKALEYLTKAEKMYSDNLWVLYHKGYCYFMIKDKENAKAYFERVLSRGKDHNPYYKKAKSFMEKIR